MESKIFNHSNTEEKLPKIFLFINGSNSMGLNGCGLAEDGTGLSGHLSTHEGWAKHDLGLTSDWKHEEYMAHYPQGYELVWLDREDLDGNDEFNLACERNKKLYEEKQKNKSSIV
jgi:hypothetical protein